MLKIDFESEEAIYIQLRNQILFGIATGEYKDGDVLPSVRQLSEELGINMHTVNKAYTGLRAEGLLRLDRRRGVVVTFDADKAKAIDEMKKDLNVVLARGCCKGISKEEAHNLVDEVFSLYKK